MYLPQEIYIYKKHHLLKIIARINSSPFAILKILAVRGSSRKTNGEIVET